MSRGKKSLRLTVISMLLISCCIVVFVASSIFRHELSVLITSHRLRESFTLLRFRNQAGLAEFAHRRTGIIFVLLRGGTFMMGSHSQLGQVNDWDIPAHSVRVSEFLIGKYEVSQGEWKGIMGRNPSAFKGDGLPVEGVSWDDCVRYCELTGLSLPTEAQWEYACKAGDCGSDYTVSDGGSVVEGSVINGTVECNKSGSNRWDIFGMIGNVYEWCADEFAPYAAASSCDPIVVDRGVGIRVLRGGSWRYRRMSSCTARFKGTPTATGNYIGVRLSASMQ